MTRSGEQVEQQAATATQQDGTGPPPHPASGARLFRYVRGYPADAWRYVGYSFGAGLSVGFLQVLLGLYVLSLGYRESFLATQELVLALCSAGFSVVAGVVVDRLGTKVSLLLSALLTVLGRFLLVAHPSRFAILGASVVVAAGIAFYWVSQGPVLAQVSKAEQRAGLFGLNWALLIASGFVGGMLAGQLPRVIGTALGLESDSTLVYRYTIWVGVLALALFSIPLLWMRAGGRESVRKQEGAWYRVGQPRKVAMLLIPVASSAAAVGFTIPFLSVFLQGTHRAPVSSIGLTLGLFALVGSLGGLLGPALSRRYRPVATVSGLLLLSAPVMLSVGYASTFALSSVALWTRGLLANSAWPVALTYLMDSVEPGQRGRASAAMNIS